MVGFNSVQGFSDFNSSNSIPEREGAEHRLTQLATEVIEQNTPTDSVDHPSTLEHLSIQEELRRSLEDSHRTASSDPNRKNVLIRLLKAIHNFFVYHFKLLPLLNGGLNNLLIQLDTNSLIYFFEHESDQHFENIFSELIHNFPEVNSEFEKRDLLEVYEKSIKYFLQKQQRRENLPVITDTQWEELKVKKTIYRLKNHFLEEPNEFLQELFPKDELVLTCMSFNSSTIPVEVLSEIEDTDENELQEFWENTLNSLFSNINQNFNNDKYKKFIISDAIQYLKVRDFLPEKYAGLLNDQIKEMDETLDPDRISDFLDTYSLLYDLSTERYTEEERQFFTEIVKPKILDTIRASIYNQGVEGVGQVSKKRLIKILAGHEVSLSVSKNSKDSQEFSSKYDEFSVRKLIKELSYKAFSQELDTLYNDDLIREMIYFYVEKIALEENHIHYAQIQSLSQHRKTHKESWGEWLGIMSPELPFSEVMHSEEVIAEVSSSYTSSQEKETELSSFEIESLMRLSRILEMKGKTYDFKLAEEDQRVVSQFFEHVCGNMDLNRRLSKYVPPSKGVDETLDEIGLISPLYAFFKRYIVPEKEVKPLPFDIDLNAVDFVRYISFKTKNLEGLSKAVFKAHAITTMCWEDDAPVPPSWRLSLEEFGMIQSLSSLKDSKCSKKLGNTFDILEALGLLNVEGSMKKLNTLVEQAEVFVERFDNIAEEKMHLHYKSGDLIAYNGTLKERFLNRKMSFEEHWTGKLFTYTHGAVLYKKRCNNEPKMTIAEIYGSYRTRTLDTESTAYSEVFRLDITKLIDSSLVKPLADLYGENWKEILNEKFQEIAQSIHQNSYAFRHIENDTTKRLTAGASDYSTLIRLLVNNPDLKERLESAKTEEDFEELAQKILSSEAGSTMICSEFATRTTIAALVKFNNSIKSEILKNNSELFDNWNLFNILSKNGISHLLKKLLTRNKYTPSGEVELRRRLHAMGWEDESIDLQVALCRNQIVEIPYEKNLNVDSVHPGKMVSLLKKKKCIEQVPHPDWFKEVVVI